jgi:hypothetical protein
MTFIVFLDIFVSARCDIKTGCQCSLCPACDYKHLVCQPSSKLLGLLKIKACACVSHYPLNCARDRCVVKMTGLARGAPSPTLLRPLLSLLLNNIYYKTPSTRPTHSVLRHHTPCHDLQHKLTSTQLGPHSAIQLSNRRHLAHYIRLL